MMKIAAILSICMFLSGCIVGTAIGVATDVVVGVVDVTTDVVGTAVDIVVPDKKKSKFSE